MARKYEPLGHLERARFSAYLAGLREAAGLNQRELAERAGNGVDIEDSAVRYFESHPAEPLSKARRRLQLGLICEALARINGSDPATIKAKVNAMAGGVA